MAAALVAAAAAEDIAINQILEYCGFNMLANRMAIQDDGLGSYKDMLQLTKKDIVALSKGFAKRPTTAAGRFVFGLRQTN